MGTIGFGEDTGFNAEVFGAEIESALNHVHDDDVDAFHEFEELQASKADGTCADDEDRFAGFWIAALDSVVTDCEGFDQGELIVGKIVAGMELVSGDNEGAFTEATVVVNADDLNAGTAVGVAFFRGRGFGIVEVRFERAFIAGFYVDDAFANGNDFQAKLMTGSTGIGEEREFTEVAGEIGATDTHAVGADDSFTGCWVFLVRTIDDGDEFWFGEFDGVHKKKWLVPSEQ